MLQENALIVIRTDGNKKIASGHIVRCLEIASCVRNLGRDVIFVVSDETLKRFVEERGGKAFVIGGDLMCLKGANGVALAEFAKSIGASKVLVDTYAVSRDFFCGLKERFPLLEIVYIDDGYNFKFGKLERPISWGVDVVINYSFGIDATKYDSEDLDGVDIYIGLAYAPIRPGFFGKKYSVRDEVKKVLVTSGSTNPKNVLETMVSGCIEVQPHVAIDVVVGAAAGFDMDVAENVTCLTGVTDLGDCMRQADLVVSAAGTTLYELCAVGVPTVAVPIAHNQMDNICGFKKMGLGKVLETTDFTVFDVEAAVSGFAADADARRAASARMKATIDGKGAERIAKLLVGSMI